MALSDTVEGSVPVTVVGGGAGGGAVTGAAAHDAAVSGAPVLIGLEARATNPTAVATGDAVRAQGNLTGKQVQLLGSVEELTVRGLTNFVDNAAADVIAAQAAGVRIVVMAILVTNAHASVGTKVSIRDNATVKVTGWAAPGGGFAIVSPVPIFVGTAATAVRAICGTTGADVDVNVWGYITT